MHRKLDFSLVKKIIRRMWLIVTFRKGVWGTIGIGNHFSEGVIIYENAYVGDYNYFAPYTLVNNAKIGNYCSVGPNCMIGLGEHDLNAISTKPDIGNGVDEMNLLDLQHPTVIEHDVWLGAGTVVKQGIRIGTGAVIGANAVVTKDVPPYSIVVGMPARVIRKRFSEEFIEKLLMSKWYLSEKDIAQENVKKLARLKGYAE